MNDRPGTFKRSPLLTVAAATVAGFAGLTLLWGIVTLFQSRGIPMESELAAERACAHHAYRSEQKACIKQWFAESQATWRTRAAK